MFYFVAKAVFNYEHDILILDGMYVRETRYNQCLF